VPVSVPKKIPIFSIIHLQLFFEYLHQTGW